MPPGGSFYDLLRACNVQQVPAAQRDDRRVECLQCACDGGRVSARRCTHHGVVEHLQPLFGVDPSTRGSLPRGDRGSSLPRGRCSTRLRP